MKKLLFTLLTVVSLGILIQGSDTYAAPVHPVDPAIINGDCGYAIGVPTSSFPTELCNAGTPSYFGTAPDVNGYYNWSCAGQNGGSTATCSAPYQITSCVEYNPLNINHYRLNDSFTLEGNDIALLLNADYDDVGQHEDDTVQNGIRYVAGDSYSFSGVVSPMQYLQVTITNQAKTLRTIKGHTTLVPVPQQVQYRKPASALVLGESSFEQMEGLQGRQGQGGGGSQVRLAGAFYGCTAQKWNSKITNPSAFVPIVPGTSFRVDSIDPSRGAWYTNDIVSQFFAWNKSNRGFSVDCQVCTMSTPVTEIRSACGELPDHALYNTVEEIQQTYTGGNWVPTTVPVYNTTPSDSECRFKCADHYTWNSSACVADTNSASCANLTVPHAISNGVTTWQTTRDGSYFTPRTEDYPWTYSLTPGTCTYQCQSGFYWNNGYCAQNPTYHWDYGPWEGACPQETQTRTATCKDNDENIVDNSYCGTPLTTQPQPEACTKTAYCALPVPSSPMVPNNGTSWTQTWNPGTQQWNPQHNGTWSYSTTPSICTFTCETGSTWDESTSTCAQIPDTYSWVTDERSECSNNQQTRDVYCTKNGSYSADESGCIANAGPKPDTTQPANCPTTGPVCGTSYGACNNGYTHPSDESEFTRNWSFGWERQLPNYTYIVEKDARRAIAGEGIRVCVNGNDSVLCGETKHLAECGTYNPNATQGSTASMTLADILMGNRNPKLCKYGIASNYLSAYGTVGNPQVQRYNGSYSQWNCTSAEGNNVVTCGETVQNNCSMGCEELEYNSLGGAFKCKMRHGVQVLCLDI